MILAIDPGLRNLGWAVFTSKSEGGYVLTACGIARSKARDQNALFLDMAGQIRIVGRPSHVVIERMKVYRPGGADPKDLVELSILGGRLASHFSDHATFVEPSVWKGQRPKETIRPLVTKYLSAPELTVLTTFEDSWKAKSTLHNVHEAIGLGLHAIGRWPR